MAIPIPTVDDFSETTVMGVIRNIVDYIVGTDGLIDAINDNDIASFTSSYANNQLVINAVKGDGTTIPVCNLTIEGGSSESNPYPTDIVLSLSGTTLNADIVLSDNNHVTGSVDLSSLSGGGTPSQYIKEVYTVAGQSPSSVTLTANDNDDEVVAYLYIGQNNSEPNKITLNTFNGMSDIDIVKSVSGSVSNGNLTITVNGVSSGDIPLPESVTVYNGNIVTDITISSGAGQSGTCICSTGGVNVGVPYYVGIDDIIIKFPNSLNDNATSSATAAGHITLTTDIITQILGDALAHMEDGIYYALIAVVYTYSNRAYYDYSIANGFNVSNHQVTEMYTSGVSTRYVGTGSRLYLMGLTR